jgi:hypothetical protein
MNASTSRSAVTTSVCDLTHFELHVDPFAHVIHDQFIAPEFYSQLSQSFPTCPPSTGPTGFSLYWGDGGYQRLLDAQPAWRALFNTFHSQSFIDWCKQQFAAVWDQEGCRIDLADARYVPYREDRIDKERATLRRVEHRPNELWVRMDIHQGQMGYDRPVHLDHARRLMSMLVYMCDHTESQMIGGELFLHDSKRPGPSRKLATRIPATQSDGCVSLLASLISFGITDHLNGGSTQLHPSAHLQFGRCLAQRSNSTVAATAGILEASSNIRTICSLTQPRRAFQQLGHPPDDVPTHSNVLTHLSRVGRLYFYRHIPGELVLNLELQSLRAPLKP